VPQVVGEVFALNIFLAALALTSIAMRSPAADATLLALGAAAVALVLFHFSRPRAAAAA
jgi:hypothetical protein